MIEKVNALIAERTTYGYHFEVFNSGGRNQSWLLWSNCAKRWSLFPATRLNVPHRITSKGEGVYVKLDANEVLAPFSIKEMVSIVKKLAPLPLYKNSYESRERQD